MACSVCTSALCTLVPAQAHWAAAQPAAWPSPITEACTRTEAEATWSAEKPTPRHQQIVEARDDQGTIRDIGRVL